MNEHDNTSETNQENSELPGPSPNEDTEEDINEHDMEVAMELDAVNIYNVAPAENELYHKQAAISAHVAIIYDQGQC